MESTCQKELNVAKELLNNERKTSAAWYQVSKDLQDEVTRLREIIKSLNSIMRR